MANTTSLDNSRIYGLDVFRAIAILMVLCSHILWIYPPNNSLLQQIITFFGFWGVELFFVLSGFLIGRILYTSYVTNDFTLKSVFQFLKRRWFRTLPNYFLILSINIGVAFYFNIVIEKGYTYFFFLQNFTSAMPAFFPESWSLAVEEFTYLLLPFCLFFLPIPFWKKKENKFLALVIFLLLVFFVNKLGYHHKFSATNLTTWNANLKSVVLYRVDAILIGVVFAWLYRNFPIIWHQQKYNFAFFGTLILLFLVFGIPLFGLAIEQAPFFWNVLYLPLTSIAFAFLLPLAQQTKQPYFSFFKGVFTAISKISYSIYLIHYTLVLFLCKAIINTSQFSIMELHFFTFFYVAITFILSYLLYRFFEKPMMDLRDKN